MNRIPLCFDFKDITEIRNIYNQCLSEKVPTNIDEAISSEIHKKIDDIVYRYFELGNDCFVTELLLERFKWRTTKSKNKKK